MFKIKRVVFFLKILSTLLLSRTFGRIIHDIAELSNGQLTVKELRKLEKLYIRNNKASLDINFLKNCRTFNVFPKFLAFNVTNATSVDVKVIRNRLLKSAIYKRTTEKRKYDRELELKVNDIRSKCNGIQWYLLYKAIQQNVKKNENKYIEIHDKKLTNLTKGKNIPFKHQDVIKNLSSYQFADDELELLKNGLSFSLPPNYIRKTDVFTQFEMISRFMCNELTDDKLAPRLKSELSHLANCYVYKYTPSKSILKKHGILKKLRNNKDIVIMRPDKGNGVVVMDRIDYDKSLLNIINDQTKFKPLNEDMTLKREKNLKDFLALLNKKGVFTDVEYKKIYPRGSQPARIYGLPKIHKMKNDSDVPPFRPIVSAVNTYNYALAKYLGTLISPYLPDEYCARDTFTFVKELKSVSLHNKFLVSYDVTSLFTNIPLNETINLAVAIILKNKKDIKMNKHELKQLFEIATKETHFLFKGQYYDQIDGVAMGSPLAPILANLFMGHNEKIWINRYKRSKPYFYKRYVDDIFAVFDDERQANEFFKYINNRHPNIKFTMETEQNKQIPF